MTTTDWSLYWQHVNENGKPISEGGSSRLYSLNVAKKCVDFLNSSYEETASSVGPTHTPLYVYKLHTFTEMKQMMIAFPSSVGNGWFRKL